MTPQTERPLPRLIQKTEVDNTSTESATILTDFRTAASKAIQRYKDWWEAERSALLEANSVAKVISEALKRNRSRGVPVINDISYPVGIFTAIYPDGT
ncbi:MAG: hypothetical protein Q7S79_03795, partial [bacterium]|nr:hypothetical protein [bacterium]